MKELTLAVVGTQFANADKSNRRFEVELCRPGDPVELRPEPRNKVDPRAVAVWRAGGGQMGYVSAERAGWVGQRLQSEDATAVFQAFDGRAAYIRIRFGGGSPSLPPAPRPQAKAAIEESDAFYPDPEGPEFGA